MSSSSTSTRRYAFGRAEDVSHPDSIRAVVSEFIATFIFVFISEGSVLAFAKLYDEAGNIGATGLLGIAIANAFGLFVAVAVALNISGGHVNPAVTFGALVGGRLTILHSVMYWVAQLLGAVIGSLFLRLATNGLRPPDFRLGTGIGDWHAVFLEIIMTFMLVYTVYATAIDPKRGSLGTIAPLAIGLIVGANILVGGPFDGAVMNPARAFGPALVGWRWRHQWIYWLGPFIGAGLAGIIYGLAVMPNEPPRTHQPLAPEEY